MIARVSACSRKRSLAMTSAGRRPACSRPRTGSSSAHTTVPRRRSVAILAVGQRDVPFPKLVSVLLVGAAEGAPKCLHAPAPLVAIEQLLDQTGSSHTPLLRIPVDSVAKLDRNLDRGGQLTSMPNDIPAGGLHIGSQSGPDAGFIAQQPQARAIHGSTTSTCVTRKSFTLRVTTGNACTKAVAAISMSRSGPGSGTCIVAARRATS